MCQIMKMKFKYLIGLFIIICVQIRLPVDMFPANSGDKRKLEAGWESDIVMNTKGNIKVNEHYYKHDDNSSTNKKEYVSIIAVGTPDLNMKAQPNVKHVAEFNLGSEHSKPTEIQLGLLGSMSAQDNGLNGDVNQARHIDLHELKAQADVNGLGHDLSTNQIKSLASLPPRALIDTKLEQVQKRLSNLTDNMSMKRNVFPTDYGKSRELTNHKITDGNRETDTNENISAHSASEKDTYSIKRPFTETPDGILNEDHNGVFWSADLENVCTKGYSETDYYDWKVKVENNDVIKMEEGCGSMQNRLITFNDSTKACVRYRINSDQMQGDIYSFYLNKLLGIHHTPPTKMSLVKNSEQWQNIWDGVIEAKWTENKPVIITKWIEALEPVFMPEELKDHKRGIRPQNYRVDIRRPVNDLCNLMQWSDLVLFDYISGNLDRVVNNFVNLKWNNKMLDKPVHNLEHDPTSGRLLFLDNESGLFHGYRLLDSYGQYHETLLKSVCVFRKSSVHAIQQLAKEGNVGEVLQQLYEQSEQSHNYLPRMGQKNMSMLKERVYNVFNHIQSCKNDNPDTSLRS